MKTLYSILGNRQKLDGGAMFGNVPKTMWQQWVQVDDFNRIELACRCLLVRETNKDGVLRNILFEVGIGAFFAPKLKQRFGVIESEHVLLSSLGAIGLKHTDIDILVLSHLHFDHAGGLLGEWSEGRESELLFPNAKILVGNRAWQRACTPHPRDKASFIPALMSELKDCGQVHLVTGSQHPILGDGYVFHLSDGHTPGMLLTEIAMPSGPLLYCADLIPGVPWVHLPITMGYDRFAEKLIDEKHELLGNLLAKNGRLFFTHDPHIACGQLQRSDTGRYELSVTWTQLLAVEQ